jgi:hypothetical protein
MKHTPRAILTNRYACVVSQLSQAVSALKVTVDIGTPFYRGEDVRENHRSRAHHNVVHYCARLQEVSLLLSECSE